MTSYSDLNAFVNEPDMFAVEQQGNLLTVKKPDTGYVEVDLSGLAELTCNIARSSSQWKSRE